MAVRGKEIIKKINMVALSWDTLLALLVVATVCFFLPSKIPADFTTSFYGVGISILSIVFSLFFAALAIIMSSSDTDFIEFLEEDRSFSDLMFTFYITLSALFISLIYSVAIYSYTDFWIKKPGIKPPFLISKIWFLIFVWLFSYSLAATFLAVMDTVKFTKMRIAFMQIQKENRRLSSTPTQN